MAARCCSSLGVWLLTPNRGHAVGVTNATLLDRKCDTVFFPDVALGVGEAMRRREFIAFVGGAAVVWPVATRAQQQTIPLIGFLNVASADGYQPMVAAFRRGLYETGYVEGQNVAIEYRWAEGRTDRLPG